ncbi:MAG: hypothetical protein JSR59_14940 [Proteobacteria bacterium]|nr:hypothetical protein [Pseudomonadota bacterium]
MPSKTGLVTLAAVAGAAILCSTTSMAANTKIRIGAPVSLGNALVDLVGSFQAYYYLQGITYDVSVTIDSNQNLKAAVTGSKGPDPYDLILTDDSELIHDLVTHHSSSVQGPPFVFARDQLDLYSISVHVGAYPTGLPADFTGPVLIPDPRIDAHGRAAARLLSERPWSIQHLPDDRVALQSDVTVVQAAVDLGMYPYGILAKSTICRNPYGTETYPEGTYHHEYPTLGGLRYRFIDDTGLATAQPDRTPAAEQELAEFSDFLKGVGTTWATDVLKSYCYTVPTP